MKHVNLFNEFMRDTVNLNQTRIDTLTSRVNAIQSFLEQSDYGAAIEKFSEQGSWAHKTIIKPPDGTDFDADILVFVEEVEDWETKDYLADLYRVFKASSTYADKVERGTRCVTIDYAGDFHLDIVPCIHRDDWWDGESFHVCNRHKNEEEETDAEGYAEWFKDKNATVGNNNLIKVVRLLKYQRDVKKTFSAKSVLLTTLVADQVVGGFDKIDLYGNFKDLPTSLKTLIGRLDNFLQENDEMPTIKNPAMESEDFNRHWDQDKYANFRSMIHKYRGWVDAAYAETDRSESLRLWRDFLGEAFAKSEIERAACSISEAVLNTQATAKGLVQAVQRGVINFGRIPFLPHAKKAPWRPAANQIPVRVIASEHSSKEGLEVRKYRSGEIIDQNSHIQFQALSNTGLPFDDNFSVHWRVVNSGEFAARITGGLRGGFEDSKKGGIRWEETSYTGIHWVEAFVVKKRTGEYVGKSDRFFVVIN